MKQALQFKISKSDLKKYLLPTAQDYEIMEKVYRLEKKKLSPEDRRMVSLIRTQLERDWRGHLIKVLNKLLKKYN